ncbi:hypothetical protein ABZW10_28035 [Kitasatospora sp. NPDC004723]|uniref:hypothetical protein n=1 Tax=Kitasatospora sp. NPDC004723 TaxID=3154288 RepID=UPI0033AA19B0
MYESTENLADMIREVTESSRPRINEAEHVEHNTYNNYGQTGAVGPNASVSNNTFNQAWALRPQELDLGKLAVDLASLRAAMQTQAQTAEEMISAGDVARAEVEANQGDGQSTLTHLRSAGRWALEIASRIGTETAILAISHALAS